MFRRNKVIFGGSYVKFVSLSSSGGSPPKGVDVF